MLVNLMSQLSGGLVKDTSILSEVYACVCMCVCLSKQRKFLTVIVSEGLD